MDTVLRDRRTDVLVVGAGPAGCTAAICLARAGVDVVVVDRARFPRDKVCGDGLAPRAVTMLQRLGLEGRLQDMGYRPVCGYRIVSTWGDVVEAGLPAFGKAADRGYVVPRRELDAMLVQEARAAGADVWEGVRAVRASVVDGAPVVRAVGPGGAPLSLTAAAVVAADGSRGSFSRTVMPSHYLTPYAVGIRAYMHGVEGLDGVQGFFLDRGMLPGYGWVFPGGRDGDPANVGMGIPVSALRRRPERLRGLFDRFISPESSAWPYLREAGLVSPPHSFPLLMDFPRGRRRHGAFLFAGDAANLVDPLSGEGIAYAFESGEAAADAVSAALCAGPPLDLGRYGASIWRGLSMEFLGAYLLRQVLVRPWGNGLMVRLLQRDEGLARGGMGVLANSVPSTWLLSPRVWRRVLTRERLAGIVAGGHPWRTA